MSTSARTRKPASVVAPGGDSRAWTFGDFTLDLKRGALLCNGADVPLRPKSFAVLVYLVERPGCLVTKHELLDAVWGHTSLTEGTLTQSLIDIRRALGDREQRMIRTVPRRGYLFELPVTEQVDVGPDGAPARATESPWAPARQRSQFVWPAGLVIGLIVAGFGLWWGATEQGVSNPPPRSAAPDHSIAVLPFLDLSPERDQGYFSDGISEEILNRLSSFSELHVIARTSSFAFKESDYDAARLSSLLGVEYLLQGSVRKDGQALRISAQLVDAFGRQLWSETFDRELAGIFAIQTEIAETVAGRIAPQVSPPPEDDALPDIEAYEHYLIAREIIQKRNLSFFRRAIDELDRAIAIDARFAEAYAERAIAWCMAGGLISPHDRPEQLRRAEEDIRTALELKPGLARAFAARGVWKEAADPLDLAGRAQVLRQALERDPQMVDARFWLYKALLEQGRPAEAYEELQRAARLDPLAPPVAFVLATEAVERGDVDDAERRLTRLLDVPHPSDYAFRALWALYVDTGRLVEALDLAKRFALATRSASNPELGLLIESYGMLGLWDEAGHWLELSEPVDPGHAATRAYHLASRGRHREALQLYRDTLSSGGADLAHLPPFQAHEYGILEVLAGEYEGGVRTLEALYGDRAGDAGVVESAGAIAGLHFLAFARQQTGAPERAAEILAALESGLQRRRSDGRLNGSLLLYQFAETAALAGDHAAARERLQRAVDAGWRFVYPLPESHPFVADERYAALRATAAARVAAERTEAVRAEAADDLAARFQATPK